MSNKDKIEEKESKADQKNNKVGTTLGWIFGVLWIFGGFGFLVNDLFQTGLLYILAGIIILPATNEFTKNNFNFEIPVIVKIGAIILLFLAT